MVNTELQKRMSELIIQLKEIKTQNNWTVQDIQNMVEEAGYHTSISSTKRLFQEGSEINPTFRYSTIKPIVTVVLGVKEETPSKDVTKDEYIAQIDALKSVALLKDTMISELEKELQELREVDAKHLEALDLAIYDAQECKRTLDNIHLSYSAEMQAIRDEAQAKVKHLLTQVDRLRIEVDYLRKVLDKFLEK
jgi:hypothetical protein